MSRTYQTICFCVLSLASFAQLTPQPSPGASLSQTIGVTEIYLEFSRPSVKGRKIFGELLPYQKVWRTGANASTTIEISNEVEIEGVAIYPGVYSLMTRPGIDSWEVYFLEDLEVSEENFFNTFPLHTLKVSPRKIPFTETFTIYFSDITDENGKLHVQWETTEIVLNIKVNNVKPVEEAIEIKSNEMAGNFQQAASYLLEKNENLTLALSYADKSIYLSETFRNNWVKAQILYVLQRYKESLVAANRAKELGETDPVYEFFSSMVNETILDLKQRTF